MKYGDTLKDSAKISHQETKSLGSKQWRKKSQ